MDEVIDNKSQLTLLRPFLPSITDEKLKVLATKMMESPFYLSDEWRNYESIWKLLFEYFNKPSGHVFYEIGDFGGILGFVNIMTNWKADVTFKLWNKDLWKPSLAKELKKTRNMVMKLFKLKRLSLDSGDERMIKFAKIFGFKVEGRQASNYMWDGKLGTRYIMRYIRKEA